MLIKKKERKERKRKKLRLKYFIMQKTAIFGRTSLFKTEIRYRQLVDHSMTWKNLISILGRLLL